MTDFQPVPVNASGDQFKAAKRKTIRKIALEGGIHITT